MWPFKTKKQIVQHTKAQKIIVPSSNWNSYVLQSDGMPLEASIAMEMYDENTAVATSVDLISTPIENMSLILVDQQTNDIVTNSTSEKLLDFIKQPNGFETQSEFIGTLVRHYKLTGNAHIALIGTGQPAEMHSVAPSIVSIIENTNDGYPDEYLISEGVASGNFKRDANIGKITRFLNSNGIMEFYHIMAYSNSSKKIKGSSPLEAAAADVRQQIAGRIHNVSLLKQGGKMSLAIIFKDEVPPTSDTIKDREEMIKDRIEGPGKAGKIGVFSSKDGIDIQNFGSTNNDMDYKNLDMMASKAIYNRFGIPLPLVDTAGSTFSNVESSIPYFYRQVVLPTANVIFKNMSKVLLPRFGFDSRRYVLTYDENKIATLAKLKLDELKERKEIGIETINELRGLLPGRPDVDGGDEILVSMTQTPLTNVGSTVGM